MLLTIYVALRRLEPGRGDDRKGKLKMTTEKGKRQLVSESNAKPSGLMDPVYVVVDIGNEIFKMLVIEPGSRGDWLSRRMPRVTGWRNESISAVPRS